MTCRAVVFDLFETLITELGAPVHRAAALANRLGVDDRRYRAAWTSRRPDIVLGRRSFVDALAEIVSTIGGRVDQSALNQLHAERVAEKQAVLHDIDPAVLAAVRELRLKGLRLAVVSNAFAEDVTGWARSPLGPLFDVAVFSYAVQLAKPDPEIYRLACRRLNVVPECALFISDDAAEVSGARAAGLRASRALWFAARWPQTAIGRDDEGLWRPDDVLDVVRDAPPSLRA